MPPDPDSRDDAHAWLKRARSNLALARSSTDNPDIMFEDLCFEAQQAVEKAIKSILVLHSIGFPKTHAITSLLTLLQGSGIVIPEWIHGAVDLTPYAVDARYPGVYESVTPEEYKSALTSAMKIVEWAEAQLEHEGKHSP